MGKSIEKRKKKRTKGKISTGKQSVLQTGLHYWIGLQGQVEVAAKEKKKRQREMNVVHSGESESQLYPVIKTVLDLLNHHIMTMFKSMDSTFYQYGTLWCSFIDFKAQKGTHLDVHIMKGFC